MRLLQERNPGLAGRLPAGSGAVLRRITHERRLNRELAAALSAADGRPDPAGVKAFCDRTLARLGISVKATGTEYLRDADRPIVCSNHPTGGVEGLALISTIIGIRGRCCVPANDLLNLVTPLQPVILPVNRGQPTRERALSLLSAFRGTDPILLFPAGVTARVQGGVLRERPWEPTFVTRARQSRRLLVPVHVSGCNSRRFYLIHRGRRALGIEFNLEMALLVDELFRRRGETVVLQFLPPRYGTGRNRSDDRRQAEAIRREVERTGRCERIGTKNE